MTEMTLVRPLRADPVNLRASLMVALSLDHSDLSTEDLRRLVEQKYGPLEVIRQGGNSYLFKEHEGEIILMVALRRGNEGSPCRTKSG